MRKILILLSLTFTFFSASAQTPLDPFVGTWSYQKNDTIFKIKLQKGLTIYTYNNTERPSIFGVYSLSVGGIMKENYLTKQPPARWVPNVPASSVNIFIKGTSAGSKTLGFTFYDQRIKHVGGEGIPCGKMHLIAPNKLHWILNEKEGLWWRVEGTDIPYELKGFSVPENVIMTKEE